MKNIKPTANKDEHILGKGKTKELELKYERMWDQNNIPKIRGDHVRAFKIQSLETLVIYT